jgi:hypothetical protein
MGATKPKYLEKKSIFGTVFKGMYQSIRAGRMIGKGGDWWQVGGEFLFAREGGDWGVKWAHRMKTTRDHAEVEDLKVLLGVA